MDDRGSVVLESILCIGLSLVVLCGIFQVGAWSLAKSLAHSAVDQGVRAGARVDVDSVPTCEDRVRQVLSNLGSGPAFTGSTYSCADDGEQVTAYLRVPLRSWTPGLGDRSTEVRALARKERAP